MAEMSEYTQGGYIESRGPIPEWLLGHCGYVVAVEQLKRYGLPDAFCAEADLDDDDDE